MKIPIFTSQLEKSRETADVANIRSAYAEASAAALEAGTANSYTATTPVAQSTGAIEKADVSAITWATLPSSVTKGTTFTVTVTLDASGDQTVTIAQP